MVGFGGYLKSSNYQAFVDAGILTERNPMNTILKTENNMAFAHPIILTELNPINAIIKTERLFQEV